MKLPIDDLANRMDISIDMLAAMLECLPSSIDKYPNEFANLQFIVDLAIKNGIPKGAIINLLQEPLVGDDTLMCLVFDDKKLWKFTVEEAIMRFKENL